MHIVLIELDLLYRSQQLIRLWIAGISIQKEYAFPSTALLHQQKGL